MVKQLLLIVTGEFNLTEYKNLATDRTGWFNLQEKAIDTPEIRCKVRAEAEDRLAILLEGEETEIQRLGDVLKRGPLTGHVTGVEELWRESKQEEPGRRRRRRRRRR